MQQHSSSGDNHDESYFASFTDMLVGVIFIFIILLMIVANNYQAATDEAKKTQAELAARNEAIELDIRKKAAEAEIRKEAEILEMKKQAAQLEKEALERQMAAAELEIKKAEALQALEAAKLAAAKPQPEIAAATPASPTGEKSGEGEGIGDRNAKRIQEQIFIDARNKILALIQQSLQHNGVQATVNLRDGTLLLPEKQLFEKDITTISSHGSSALRVVASVLESYLPCISGTQDASRLRACAGLDLQSTNGLESVFIEDHTSTTESSENRLLTSAEKGISVFRELIQYEPYLDKGLKNISGSPIMNVRSARTLRTVAQKKGRKQQPVSQSIELKFVVRTPNPGEIRQIKASASQ